MDGRERADAGRGGAPGTADREIARELVEEVLRTALALEEVMAGLLEELPPRAFAGEDNARVLLGMVVGSVLPAARAAGLRDTRSAIALVGAIRERVLTDLHAAAELANERE